jgi:hypothetical protein
MEVSKCEKVKIGDKYYLVNPDTCAKIEITQKQFEMGRYKPFVLPIAVKTTTQYSVIVFDAVENEWIVSNGTAWDYYKYRPQPIPSFESEESAQKSIDEFLEYLANNLTD